MTGTYEKVVLYWAQVRNKTNKKGGDKAIIESIHRGEVKVIFADDDLKSKILYETPYPFTHAFIVDVSVETVQGNPVLYKVTKFYDTIEWEPQAVT